MDPDERKPLLAKDYGQEVEEYKSIEARHRSNSSINSGGQVIINSDHEVQKVFENSLQHSYKRRWYILFLFSSLCFLQNLVWNTWGPLAESIALALGWTKADVALQANWGCITYVISAAFFSWLMDVKGLRMSCVLTAALIASGSALRCITMEPMPATWLINVGQILNGFAGPVLMAGPPLVSAIWFPAYQRATATSIALLSMNLGLAGSFVIGPLMVPNVTLPSNTSFNVHSDGNETSEVVMITRFNILRLMYVECLCCVAAFLALLIYFPNKPTLAPSLSAATKRIEFKVGMRQLLRHRGFWKVSICYSLLGIGGVWSSLVNFFVTDLISELEAGWLGFIGSLVSGVAGCILSRYTDVYARRLKCILLILFSFSLSLCIVFSLECMKIIPFNRGILYTTFIGTMLTVGGSSPLFFELVCETAFPIAEGLTNGIQTWMNNFVGLIFLLMFMIPAIGNSTDMQWMNWTMAGSLFVSIPILVMYKESYNRLDLDTIIITNGDVLESVTENGDTTTTAQSRIATNGTLPSS